LSKDSQWREVVAETERAIKAAREARDPAGEARILWARAEALEKQDRPAEAAVAEQAAAAAWDRAGYGPGKALSLAQSAILLLPTNPARGNELLAQAVAAARSESMRPLTSARVMDVAGRTLYQKGFFPQARQCFLGALAIRERLLPDSAEVASVSNSLGAVAAAQGDLATAWDCFQRALALQVRAAGGGAPGAEPPSLDVADVLNNLGAVAASRHDLDAAADYFQRSYILRSKLAPGSERLAGSLDHLGDIALRRSDWAAAEDLMQQALDLRTRLAPGSLDVAISLYNLGNLALFRVRLDEAEGYLRRSLEIRERLAPASPEVAKSLVSLGVIARARGNLPGAREYFTRALRIEERVAPDSHHVAEVLNNLGNVLNELGDRKAAREIAERVWRIARQEASLIACDEVARQFNASIASYCAALMRRRLDSGLVREAFTAVEEGRARALRRLLLERQVNRNGPGGTLWSDYQTAVANRDRAETVLSQAGVSAARAEREVGALEERGGDPGVLATARAALRDSTARLDSARAAYTRARIAADELWMRISRANPRANLEPLDARPALHAVPRDSIYLALVMDSEETTVFTVGPGSWAPIRAVRIPIGEAELRSRAVRFGLLASDPAADPTHVQAIANSLFAQLFPASVRREIMLARRLLISPDGPLWNLPFAALTLDKPGPARQGPRSPGTGGRVRYLGLEKPITLAPSLSVYAECRRAAPGPRRGSSLRALVVGNPVFDRGPPTTVLGAAAHQAPSGERSFLFEGERPPPPLPGTAEEATGIARLYGGKTLTGEAATEAAVRARIEKADLVHLATHGYLHPVRAMSSGVLLSPPENEPGLGETSDDGALQAWEIFSQLHLKAELVVLSACETGLGENVPAEGIVGLTRALQVAGARSIVASHWKVADQSTARLMVAFHRYLRRGLAKDESLRLAMKTVQSDPRTAHPFYWAPFFLTGDPENHDLGRMQLRRPAPRRARPRHRESSPGAARHLRTGAIRRVS
jgi:CHAT domain-containing protein/tetratricopeptide (TPR) repeat protein